MTASARWRILVFRGTAIRAIFTAALLGGFFAVATGDALAAEAANPPACSAPAPTRTGKLIAPSETLPGGPTELTLGVGMTGLAAIVATRDTPPPHPVWCREADVTVGGATMQVLRNIGERFDSVTVQRIVTDNGTAFAVVASIYGSIGLNRTRNAADETWHAHLLYGASDGRPAVFATFDNEPEPQIVAVLIAEIVAGTRKPFVVINGQGVFMISKPK